VLALSVLITKRKLIINEASDGLKKKDVPWFFFKIVHFVGNSTSFNLILLERMHLKLSTRRNWYSYWPRCAGPLDGIQSVSEVRVSMIVNFFSF
jgi:hypothetical protein